MKSVSRAGHPLAALCALLFLAASACREPAPPRPAAEAPPARPAALAPDSASSDSAAAMPLAETAPAPDSLFAAYDAATLAALRPDTTGAAAWVDSTLAALTLEEKVGQLFIVDLPAPRPLGRVGRRAMRAAEEYSVGGFLVKRILGPRQVARQTRRLQRAATVPLFFAADYERGAGRFANNATELPSNMALGAARSAEMAAAAGRLTAIESRAVGVNLLFAPVVDVNNNPDNPIINIRSYGERPRLVAEMAEGFVQGAAEGGLLTTLKHFPGHGNTATDSHAQMGTVESTAAELDSVELAPYRLLLAGEDDAPPPAAVMTAHLWIKALDADPLPATFSEKALTRLLREEMRFGGLVITDDVKMGALQNDFSLAERTLRPLEAGADIVLTPEDLPAAIDAVKEAVQSGRLSEDRLDASVRRVLTAKARAGLHRQRIPSEALLERLLNEPRGQQVAAAIAAEAVTLLKTAPALPLDKSRRTLLVQLSNYKDSESIAAAMDLFEKKLGGGEALAEVRFDGEPSERAREKTLAAAREAEAVVLALYLRLTTGRGEAGLFPDQARLARALVESGTPVVLVAFGNPYAVAAFPEAEAQLVAYDQTLASIRAAADVLAGEAPPRGRLPIRIGAYGYGAGLGGLDEEEAARAE